MSNSTNVVLGFELDSFDDISSTMQHFYLKYFLQDNTLEIIQKNSNKTYLKRIFYPSVQLSDLYLGQSINIYSRLYTLTAYANNLTESYMKARETHFLIETKAMDSLLKIMSLAKKFEMSLGSIRSMDSYHFASIVEDSLEITPDSYIVQYVGVDNSKKDQYKEFYNKVNVLFGTDSTILACSYVKVNEIFDKIKSPIRVANNSTLCIIKPHVVKSNQAVDILNKIVGQGFQIRAMLSMHMTLSMAEELFDVYRSIIPNFFQMLQEICSGNIIALMITKNNYEYSVVDEFRNICGPLYPEIAKALRPSSIRALYGVNPFSNAVHCTDLSDDGEMECRYVFETIGSL